MVTPGDADGANLSRVPDPLGGPGYALRQYGVLDEDGARSQVGLYSFSQPAFRNLALSGVPVYVAMEWYFPDRIVGVTKYVRNVRISGERIWH